MTRTVRVFIYKRTHRGDPDESGSFGIHKCMGECRSWEFDAVIGVGGLGSEARKHRIDRKVNWIGIGPHRDTIAPDGWPVITFDHFVLYNEKGAKLKDFAPQVAHRTYKNPGPRFVFSDKLNHEEQKEVRRLLKMAENAPPSRRARQGRADVHCHPKCRPPVSKGCAS